MNYGKSLFLTLSLIAYQISAQNSGLPSDDTITANKQLSSSGEGFSKSTIIGGGIIVGAVVFQSGRLVLRSAFGLTKALIKKPLIAGTLGTMIIAPILEETLFAKDPDLDAASLALKISNRWKTQRLNAENNIVRWNAQLRQKYDVTMHELQTKHPEMYALMMRLDQQPVTQDIKHVIREIRAGARSAVTSLKQMLEEQQPSEPSQKQEAEKKS